MHIRLRLSLSIAALTMPFMTMAAPVSVTGITAKVEPDGIHVQWDAVSGNIAHYRVFYSHESILNTGGLYDEFEKTSGAETRHILRNIPNGTDIYISVLAVDANGVESAFFTEEAHVVLTDTPTASATSSAASVAEVASSATNNPLPSVASSAATSSIMSTNTSADALRLLSVDVVSSTGVTLHFSHPVNVDPSRATEAVLIETASGNVLAMKRFTIQGNAIHVDTDVQERTTVYTVKIGEAITAFGTSGERLTVDPNEAPMLFIGHMSGKEPVQKNTKTSEVVRLRLRAQPTGSTYRVEATWQPAEGDVKQYAISQTTDGGKTYSAPQAVKPDERDLIIADVPAGTFGIRVVTVFADGSTSKGLSQQMDLPRTNGTSIQGSVTRPTGGSSKALPNSGPALALAISMTGALTGYLHTRRKKEQESLV